LSRKKYKAAKTTPKSTNGTLLLLGKAANNATGKTTLKKVDLVQNSPGNSRIVDGSNTGAID
jgi:hypothetical protein